MRGNNVMNGYYEQPEATAEAFRGGWFHSGDIGGLGPRRLHRAADRKKDIIISGGENISTIEVEQAVAKHPAVLECAVVAVPDQKWASCRRRSSRSSRERHATEAEIIEFCKLQPRTFQGPGLR